MASQNARVFTAKTPRSRLRQDHYAPYFFISPFFILFTIFFLFPSLFAIGISFYKWKALGVPEFFGTRNFERLLTGDPIFWQAVKNTLFYAAASLFIVAPLALLEALALNSKRLKFRTFWRAIYFAPIVTSTAAIAIVFRMLYNREFGFLNEFIMALGGMPVDWLGNRNVVKFSVMGVVLWRWTGLLAIYFLAGLQSIPDELYEAAAIDGATQRQRFFHITLPSLRPVMLFVAVIVSIGSIQIFDDPQILTQGGPANASLSVVQYLYTRGISDLLYGYASAVGVFLFVVIFILSMVQLRLFRGGER
jgi:multiple sugar transport system permease protein/lactose/L-arabinose transport system permease protein